MRGINSTKDKKIDVTRRFGQPQVLGIEWVVDLKANGLEPRPQKPNPGAYGSFASSGSSKLQSTIISIFAAP
jgi:hypothetical protein